MKIPHQRVPPSPHRSQKCHGPTPKEHRQETEAGPRTSWRTFVTNGWLNTASGSSSTVSFLPLPLDLVRSWLHVQTSPKEDLLPSGTYVPERTAILQGNPASEARRPQSPREPGRWLGARLPLSWPQDRKWAPQPGRGLTGGRPAGTQTPPGGGCHLHFRNAIGVPSERSKTFLPPVSPQPGTGDPQSPPSLWLEGCSRPSPSAWEASVNLGAHFLLPRVRGPLTVGTVRPPSHTPSTTQLAQPFPGDVCCRPSPGSHPGPHVAAFNPRGGGGGR